MTQRLLQASMFSIPLLYLMTTSGAMAEHNNKASYTLLYENDMIGDGKDQNYTSGIRFAYVSPKNNVPHRIAQAVSYIPNIPAGSNRRYSLAIGQSIFTPQGDKKPIRTVVKDDRPYAGWLYATAGVIVDTKQSFHTAEITVGMVGPASGAEKTQHWIHREITDSPIAEGWDHQLKNELGLNLHYGNAYHWKKGILDAEKISSKFSKLEWDITPSSGFSIGNIYTNIEAGATFRVGRHLSADYGPPHISPNITGSDYFETMQDGTIGWYAFIGFEERYVARDIFLDGNTRRKSHSVAKKKHVSDKHIGVAILYKDIRIAYTMTHRTRQFKTQRKPQKFGAITMTVQF